MIARPRACLFDLDGTLIDSIPLILTCFRHTFRVHLGEVPPDEAWIAGIGTPLESQLRHLTGDEALARRMAHTYRDFQHAHHDELLKEFPGTPEALAALRAAGHPIAVVTSKMHAAARRGLERARLDKLVDVVIDADSSVRHKPDPEPVLLALQQLGRMPDEAVFVGDAPVDIQAGRAAGARTIAALCGPFSRARLAAEKPDAFVDDVRGVLSVISSWANPPRTAAGG